MPKTSIPHDQTAIVDILNGTRSTLLPVAQDHVTASPAYPGEGRSSGMPVTSVVHLGELVRQARGRLGFNQQRFADLAGVGRRFVSELEAGKPSLEFERVLRCCRAAGIDLFARPRQP